mgnify:CR=1 FL=1
MPLKTLAVDGNEAELIRSMQRQQHIDAGLLSDTDVRFEQPPEKITYTLGEDEAPCTRINHLSLDNETERTFSFLPSAVIKETAFKTGMCLGSNNLNKLQKAVKDLGIKEVAIAGGVSANSELRKAMQNNAEKQGWNIFIPKFEYTTDNAAMIAMVAQLKYERGEFTDLRTTATSRYDF